MALDRPWYLRVSLRVVPTLRTQRFTLRASPLTMTAYTHPSDEEPYEVMRGTKL